MRGKENHQPSNGGSMTDEDWSERGGPKQEERGGGPGRGKRGPAARGTVILQESALLQIQACNHLGGGGPG